MVFPGHFYMHFWPGYSSPYHTMADTAVIVLSKPLKQSALHNHSVDAGLCSMTMFPFFIMKLHYKSTQSEEQTFTAEV